MSRASFANRIRSIGGQIGCDKVLVHSYEQAYALHLEQYVDSEIRLLEIGVGGEDYAPGGESLKLWSQIFPKARIYGLDIYDKSHLDSDRIKTFLVDQSNQSQLEEFFADQGDFDIIIDDGSHRREHVLASLFVGINHVRAGGHYVIEDFMTSYWPVYGGSTIAKNFLDTPSSWVKKAVDIVHRRDMLGVDASLPNWSLASTHIYPGIVFMCIGDTKSNIPEGGDFFRNQVDHDKAMYGQFSMYFEDFEKSAMNFFDKNILNKA